MSVGENIKRLREVHGLTQTQLGDIAGVSDKAVSTWESGQRKPRMGAIEKISQHFGISKSEILFGDGDNFHRLPGGWGSSSYLVDVLLDNPPSPNVVAPLIDYYSEKTAAPQDDGLSPLEAQLMRFMRRLTDDQKRMLLAQIELLLKNQG